MKKLCLFMLIVFSVKNTMYAAAASEQSGITKIADQLVEERDGKKVVGDLVAAFLRNDGLFTEHTGPISLEDAVQKTQSTWFNKEWKYARTEDDIRKAGRIEKGNMLLKALHNEDINATAQADTIIGYGAVLPSTVKMLLAAKKAVQLTGARRLIVITSNEPSNDAFVQATPVEQYAQASELLGECAFSAVTQDTKPRNQKEMVELVRQGFKGIMSDVAVEYVDKKEMPDFVQKIQVPTKMMVAGTYPQLEMFMLMAGALAQKNQNCQVVAGVTAGPLEEFAPLYDTIESPEARYNFERDVVARVLYRLAEYYKGA